ncbi:MAG: sensor domain-containing protein, partial [Actinomycetota bacterium]
MMVHASSTDEPAPVLPPIDQALLDRLTGGFGRLFRRTAYLLVGFPLALLSFVTLVTGLALGAGTLITFLGLPILTATVLAARMLAGGERQLLHQLMDRDVASVTYRSAADSDSPIRRLTRPLTDPQSWRDVAHGLITFPVSVAGFVITVTWWSTALAGTTWYAWGWILPSGDGNQDLPELLGLGDAYLVRAAFYAAAGLGALITLPFVIGGVAAVRSLLADA